MKLVIAHYHFRPGGVRRVIELATPHIVRGSRGKISSVTLATGEAPGKKWLDHFTKSLPEIPVELFVEPAFGYFAEQRATPAALRRRTRRQLAQLLTRAGKDTVIWVHNLGLARNLLFAQELIRACESAHVPLLAHHHDWWFDNRWQRFVEAKRSGFRSIDSVAKAIFGSPHPRHLTINQSDAKILRRHFGNRVYWLPNIAEPTSPPPKTRVRAAHAWLQKTLHTEAPVWLLPCRLLRRKNPAEALLLTRWLRPEAWLVTTAAVSSASERHYAERLSEAALTNKWPLKLSVLAGEKNDTPTVPDLLAASEAVLLTSIQEGFGLPYLEASAAQRPLIARSLPNISPDLAKFGFQFPQLYNEVLVSPQLFDWNAESARQQKRFKQWRARLPVAFRKQAKPPVGISISSRTKAIPFSRLTLTAQLEVLAHPPQHSWKLCAPLNKFSSIWQRRATRNQLQITRWSRNANQWLSGPAYAKRFFAALKHNGNHRKFSASEVQAEFIQHKLAAENIYPLLWHTEL